MYVSIEKPDRNNSARPSGVSWRAISFVSSWSLRGRCRLLGRRRGRARDRVLRALGEVSHDRVEPLLLLVLLLLERPQRARRCLRAALERLDLRVLRAQQRLDLLLDGLD